MFENLHIDMSLVYPTFVISTMSSGKSTLINALVGKELLPSSNRACTAKSIAILDNDMQDEFLIHAIDKDENYSLIHNADQQTIIDYNHTNELKEMIIEGEISGIKNSKKSLFIIDTPGVNNSMDISHENVTKKTLEEYSEGLIIYVINALQLATYDDSAFLSFIADKVKNNSKFKIIFAINKMDSIDPEKEDPKQLIDNCRHYIEERGIDDPIVIPISASGAVTIKKILKGDALSETQEEDFSRLYRHFHREGFSLKDFAIIPEIDTMSEYYTIDGKQYTKSELIAVLENTGVPLLEKMIDDMLVDSLKMKAPKITLKKRTQTITTNRKKTKRNRKRKKR